MSMKLIRNEILVNQMEVLKTLIKYNLNTCVTTCKFMEFVMNSFEVSETTRIDLPLIAMELIASFDALETKKEGKLHRL